MAAALRRCWDVRPVPGPAPARLLVVVVGLPLAGLGGSRGLARRRRDYVRLRLSAHRIDRAAPEALVDMFEALHKRLLQRWWRRLVAGQPSLSLEVHHVGGEAFLAVACPRGSESLVESALRAAYPNVRLEPGGAPFVRPSCLLRLKKRARFIEPLRVVDPRERDVSPANRLLMAIGAVGADAVVQLALTPAPISFERWARRRFRRHEAALSAFGGVPDERRRSEVELAELRGALDLQHRPLFFFDLRVGRARSARVRGDRVGAASRGARNASSSAARRCATVGCGSTTVDWSAARAIPLPSFQRGVLAPTELPRSGSCRRSTT